MASAGSVEALRNLTARLDAVSVKTTGQSHVPKDASSLSLEQLVSAIETLAASIPNLQGGSHEAKLVLLLKRLEAVELKVTGSTAHRDSGSLEKLVSGFESVSISLEGKLRGGAPSQAPKKEEAKPEPKKEEPKAEVKVVPKEEPKVEAKKEEPKKEEPKAEPKKEEPKKEEPKKEEPKKEEPKKEELKQSSSKEELKKSSSKDLNKKDEGPSDEEIMFSGDLEKLGGGVIKKWQKRHFMLKPDRLQWYAPGEADARNELLFKEMTKVHSVEESRYKKKRVLQIETTGKKDYYLHASEDANFALWLAHLMKAASTPH